MATSIDNLKEAFAGESQANQKYRTFAAKAERTGSRTSRGCSARRPKPSASTPKDT